MKKKIVDEVLVYMKAPIPTHEDVVKFILTAELSQFVKYRYPTKKRSLAEPGEFTKQAF